MNNQDALKKLSQIDPQLYSNVLLGEDNSLIVYEHFHQYFIECLHRNETWHFDQPALTKERCE